MLQQNERNETRSSQIPRALIRVHLLGEFGVTCNGQLLEGLHRRKCDRLLAYLALHAGHWVDKSLLASLFWDRGEVYDAEQNLRQSLTHLRKLLLSGADCIESRVGALRLNAQLADVDTSLHDEPWQRHDVPALYLAATGDASSLLCGWSDDWIAPFRDKYAARTRGTRTQLGKEMSESRDAETAGLASTPHSEPIGGVVLLGSPFYIVRSADSRIHDALLRHESTILIKGARQTGKSSLLARAMSFARSLGTAVFHTDFERFSQSELRAADTFYIRLMAIMAEQCDQEFIADRDWKPHLGASGNLEAFVQRRILNRIGDPILWGLDGVDRLFEAPHFTEFFALLRGFHTKHATEAHLGWNRFTVVLATATEPHLYIRDLNQSPFNVGTRIALLDFTPDQCEELRGRFSSLRISDGSWRDLRRLVGGHPYLLQRSLHEIRSRTVSVEAFIRVAEQDLGPFHDHLEDLLRPIRADRELTESVIALLHGKPCSERGFYRLRSAGLFVGNTPDESAPRCGLYGHWFVRGL